MSIKARLLVTISVLIALAFAGIGVATVQLTRAQMVERVDDSLRATTERPDKDGPGGRRNHVVSSGYAERATAILYCDPDGTIASAEPSGFPGDPDPLPDLPPDVVVARAGMVFTADAVDGSNDAYRVLVRPLPGGGPGQVDGFLAVAAPLDDVNATIRSLTAVIVLTGVAVLAVVVGAVWLIIRRGLRPIDSMIASAGLIASGDLSHRVEVDDATGEVGQLGAALNIMLGRIEASFAEKEASEARLRQFVADASHELRTPLTSIRGYAELYRSGAATSPQGLARVMTRIESEGARMGRLVDDLLLLARLDQGRPLERERVDLVQLVDDALTDARVVEPDRPLSYEHPDDIHVLGDADRLRQVLDNLLANVRVHTGPGTPVRVALRTTPADAVLSVADDGPGIAPEDAAHVFDRFYRVDPARARTNGGAGLGLSIVASIVAAHDGQVRLDSAPGTGTTFIVTLPRFVPAQPEPELQPAATAAG
jgi:two-component system OmpR family sensor kinase